MSKCVKSGPGREKLRHRHREAGINDSHLRREHVVGKRVFDMSVLISDNGEWGDF